MPFSHLTKHAISHTLHCLTGCSIGEVLGMAAGSFWQWPNWMATLVSVALAFFFGYLLTMLSLRRESGLTVKEAFKTALATDTVSIVSMETIDNTFLWLVPGALDAHISSSFFWLSLLASLVVAFFLTVPVNRWFLSRGKHSSF